MGKPRGSASYKVQIRVSRPCSREASCTCGKRYEGLPICSNSRDNSGDDHSNDKSNTCKFADFNTRHEATLKTKTEVEEVDLAQRKTSWVVAGILVSFFI